jgi:hypothetical protein
MLPMCQKMAYAVSLHDENPNEGDDTAYPEEGDDEEESSSDNSIPDFSAADGRTFRDPIPDLTQEEGDPEVADGDEFGFTPEPVGGNMSN